MYDEQAIFLDSASQNRRLEAKVIDGGKVSAFAVADVVRVHYAGDLSPIARSRGVALASDFARAQQEADNFALAQSASVQTIQWWGAYANNGIGKA
jgi:hypothetical protein